VAVLLNVSSGQLLAAPLIAIFIVAMSSGRKTSLIVAGASFVAASAGVVAGWRPTSLTWADFVLPLLVIWAAWAVGDNFGVRRAYLGELADKAARAEAERDAATERATAEERARIARELHDVVAHHVSVIAIQAGAARMLSSGDATPGDGTAATLRSIELEARQALGELRKLLGVLRHDGDPTDLAPQPRLEQLDKLIGEVRQAGLPVESRTEGRPASLSPMAELSAYRIVQEALTNVLKHQGRVPTTVLLRYEPDELEIGVTSRSASPAPASPPGVGHGLIGMRERLSMLGGELEAGARPDGTFAVLARIPREAAAG
jgi:signal transduction histidine kinase